MFGEAPTPLLVLKQARDGDLPVATEAAALREAEPAALAPRWLGTVAGADAQEALPGRPLRVEPIDPEAAAAVAWPAPLSEIARALARMATVTAKPEPPTEWRPLVERALADGGLTSRSHALLAAAVRDVGRAERSVLAHRDLSPQNCLIDHGGLSGLVDWETAHSRSLPGIDAWVAAISYFEHGIGLVRWGEEEVVQAFADAWATAPFFAEARRSTTTVARAAGDLATPPAEALVLVYSALRLGHRLKSPEAWPTGPWAATRTLEIVAGGLAARRAADAAPSSSTASRTRPRAPADGNTQVDSVRRSGQRPLISSLSGSAHESTSASAVGGVEGVHGIHLELDARREAGQLVVVGDLEAEQRVTGREVALHRGRALGGAQGEHLEPAAATPGRAHLAEEGRVPGVRCHRGGLAPLPARRLERQEVLDRGGVGTDVAGLRGPADGLGQPPALAPQLLAVRAAEGVVQIGRLGAGGPASPAGGCRSA